VVYSNSIRKDQQVVGTGYNLGPGWGWGWWGGPTTTTYTTYTTQEGKLVVDIADAKGHQHLWRGAGIAARSCEHRRLEVDRGRRSLSIGKSLRAGRDRRANWPGDPVATLRTVLTIGRETQSVCRSPRIRTPGRGRPQSRNTLPGAEHVRLYVVAA